MIKLSSRSIFVTKIATQVQWATSSKNISIQDYALELWLCCLYCVVHDSLATDLIAHALSLQCCIADHSTDWDTRLGGQDILAYLVRISYTSASCSGLAADTFRSSVILYWKHRVRYELKFTCTWHPYFNCCELSDTQFCICISAACVSRDTFLPPAH